MSLLTLTNRARRPASKFIYLTTFHLGTDVDLYFPQESKSIYNDEDSDYSYPEIPDWSGRLLLTQLIQEGQNTNDMDMILAEISDRKLLAPFDMVYVLNPELRIAYKNQKLKLPLWAEDGRPQYYDIHDQLKPVPDKDFITELPLNTMISINLTDQVNAKRIQGTRLRIDTASIYGNNLYQLYGLVPME
jgi:hypothetical protein